MIEGKFASRKTARYGVVLSKKPLRAQKNSLTTCRPYNVRRYATMQTMNQDENLIKNASSTGG